MSNFCVAMPAYNEAKKIGEAAALARSYAPLVLVVDDGSTDATAAEAEAAGAEVARLPKNSGKGKALQTGFEIARRRGFEMVVTLDADGQHDPRDIPRFLEARRRSNADAVLGARTENAEQMPIHRRLNNRWISMVGSWLGGQRAPDFQCGFRLYRLEPLRSLRLETSGFEFESELLIQMLRAGWKVEWTPIKAVYGDETSHVRAGREMARFTRLFFRQLTPSKRYKTQRQVRKEDAETLRA